MSITKSKRKQANGLIRGVKILAFGLMLAVMGFIGLMWFLRPDTSVIEKRTLTEFPFITWSSFWDGSFFKAVDTWYADTYPLREGLISGSQSLENHYGLRSDQIVGEALVADDIPDPDAAGEEVQAAEPEEVLPVHENGQQRKEHSARADPEFTPVKHQKSDTEAESRQNGGQGNIVGG